MNKNEAAQRGPQVFFCRPNRAKSAASLDVFAYGNTGYLSIHTADHAESVALAGNAAEMVLALRDAADELEKKLFLREHREQARREQLRSAQNWDWLTPEMVIKYFEQSPILAPVAADVRAVLAKAWPAAGASALPTASPLPSQLDLDLKTIEPHLEKITAGGKINKSEIARLLGLKASGPSSWRRVTEIAQVISSSSEEEPRPAEMTRKSQSAAA